MGVLEGKIAIVTGAGRGIGCETAKMFAAQGARVVVNDLGSQTDGSGESRIADEVVAAIRAEGGEAVASYDSVATMEGGRRIFETALDHFGALDILVNNAGILRDKTIFKLEEDDWDAVMAVHLKGHFACTSPFARYIRSAQRPGCRIINFSSVSGLRGNFGQSNYGAAKAGIAGFTRVLALELRKYGCTVNAISPGEATRMTIPLAQGRGQQVDPEHPQRSPKGIAPVVTWVASEAASDLTGQIIQISRGVVGILQQPAVIRSFQTSGLWSLEDLDRVMPALLDAKRSHDERVRKEGAPESIAADPA